SPDGRRFLYLSRRSPLSVDLYLGDANTGISLRRLTSLSLDPRVTSLQSAASAGSWAPDNRRVVLGDEQDGRAELVIIDVDRNQVEERIPFPRLGSILAPAWSPDGRSIAFSAMDGGRSNLYLYSLADRRLRVLTRDPFGAIEPAWSPDGQRIAFVTDRLTPRVADLRLGRYRLAVIDLATGRIESLQTFATGKSVDPQWSPDGRSLLFVSDRDGISNVYRLSLADGRLSQLTNLQTGVTGLTPLSPAISVARNAPRMLFSAFQDAGNVVLRLDGAAALAGVAPTDRLEGLHAAQLPPVPAQHAGLTALERDPTLGIVPADAITEEPYTPKMSLDHIGLPDQVAVGDPIGSIVDGGVSLFWKDLAGTRTVALGLQVGSTFGPRFTDRLQNGAAALAFQDYTHRWGLGLLVQQTPHLVGAFRTTTANIDGTPVTVKSKTEFRQIYRGLFAVASYPFNDAQRLDVSAGYQNLTLDQITEVKSTSLQSGLLAGVAPPPAVPHVDAVQLMQSTVAFVSDRSVFGATSPVAGQRYRVQITMSGGTLAYEEVLADYRRYFRPDPAFTIATRIIHDGRYGPGAEDPRLLPLSVGYRELVRGYDLSSFNVNDCQPTATQSCPAIDQLLGSRTLTANVELRFPLQQAFGFGSRFFRSLPTELAIFGDAGYAWHSDEARQPFLVGPRHPVTSVGFAARVNLFGYAIGEIDLVRPFDRPHAGWMFAFGLSPGF
ncbi:MAG TPA: hypothetical protein VND92_06310, partial [Vicinamibacterales bacterium]|nr:hypothetical protein [Vicinamibacterales bacterium]